MKKSRYNIFVTQKGFTICYNTFTNNYLAISNNVYNMFRNEKLSAFQKRYPQHYDSFVQQGFIISKEMDELNLIRFRHKKEAFASRNYFFMVYPTQDCNLKCWYCYETHVTKSIMSIDVQKRIQKHVELKIKKNAMDSFHLTFFGGEPLMHFDKVAYPLSLSLKNIVEQNNKTFSCGFITNGSLINETMIKKLKKLNPHFQITIDGHREKHDNVRIGKYQNTPTYDKIIKAIHKYYRKYRIFAS